LYQNDRGSEFFIGFFDARHEEEKAAVMRHVKYENQKIGFLAEGAKTLSRADRGSIDRFDEIYKPSLGWEDYYKNY
jgi:hypothetical protein